jgi:hypothetical protein
MNQGVATHQLLRGPTLLPYAQELAFEIHHGMHGGECNIMWSLSRTHTRAPFAHPHTVTQLQHVFVRRVLSYNALTGSLPQMWASRNITRLYVHPSFCDSILSGDMRERHDALASCPLSSNSMIAAAGAHCPLRESILRDNNTRISNVKGTGIYLCLVHMRCRCMPG